MPAKTAQMVSDEILKKQLSRLRGFHGFEDLKSELLRIFQRHAKEEGHAERVIDSILDTRRPSETGFVSCPIPAELKDYCEAAPVVDPSWQKPDPNCPNCKSTPGWRFGTVPYQGPAEWLVGTMVEGSVRCECTKRR